MYKGLIASIKRKEIINPYQNRKKTSNSSNKTTTPLPSNRQSSTTLNASTTVKQAIREKVIKIPHPKISKEKQVRSQLVQRTQRENQLKIF